MPIIDRGTSTLLVVDFQSRLMPAIENAAAVVANARRLLEGARLLDVPVLFTEENAGGLGSTLPELHAGPGNIAHKMTFDACRAPGFLAALHDRPDVVICGCETHVCVLQSALGLLAAGRHVFAVRDAMGSRRSESKETAIRRLEQNGAEIVTTEMVLFEWLTTAEDPRLDRLIALVR
jgi:nicotinamidase-related amidase